MEDDAPELRLVTVLEDDDGMVHVNHEGIDEMHALWLLESAKHILLASYWDNHDEDEDD